MTELPDLSRHSRFTDPGPHAEVLAEVPPDPAALSVVARNLIEHYRASEHDLPADTRDDVNLRWLAAILATDQDRNDHAPLAQPREPQRRVQGCCRDHTLLGVGVLRQHGVGARSRVGFAGYFTPGHHHDHVIVERWQQAESGGQGRWVGFDAEIAGPSEALPDPLDIEIGLGRPFESAAAVWQSYRAGGLDPTTYAIEPGSDIGGPWLIRNYVLLEAAHRFGDEMLLWDGWGAMAGPEDPEPDAEGMALVDEVADLLVRADAGDATAEAGLYERYVADPRLHPGSTVLRFSPLGESPPVLEDLTSRRDTQALR